MHIIFEVLVVFGRCSGIHLNFQKLGGLVYIILSLALVLKETSSFRESIAIQKGRADATCSQTFTFIRFLTLSHVEEVVVGL
jgi:hypothetical protein